MAPLIHENKQIGVPQGSLLALLLFNMPYEVFLLMNGTEVCNYANDIIRLYFNFEVKNVILRLEANANHLTTWFLENYVELNEEQFHPVLCGISKDRVKPRLTFEFIRLINLIFSLLTRLCHMHH